MLAVHFGAGNIGRGFIGLLLARSGFEVCFVDVNPQLVAALRERGRYTLRVLGEEPVDELVTGVTALDARDREAVAAAIARAELVTTSVGPNALAHVAPLIAEGLRRRGDRPLNVIACENMVGASGALGEHVLAHTGGERFGAGFPDAVVDRIVPNRRPEPGEDPLLIAVEPYYEWLVDAEGVVGSLPPVKGLTLVRNLKAYTERKIFGLNTGHAVVAYLGYLKGYRYIHEAVADPLVRASLMQAFVEAGLALAYHHGFGEAEQADYYGRLLRRFGNRALADTVVRVGRDPLRKLGVADRLVAPARLAVQKGIYPRSLARGIAAGFLFDVPQDPAAAALVERVRLEGLDRALSAVTGVEPSSVLHRMVREEYALLRDTLGSAEMRQTIA